MIIDMLEPKDVREAVSNLYACQKTTTESIALLTQALQKLGEWTLLVDAKLVELERKTDLLMKATRFSPSSASLK